MLALLLQDLLLADLLNSHGHLILKVQEHDSLLENKVDEQLSEEERKAAWLEFQQEKDRVERAPPPVMDPSIRYTNEVAANPFANILLTDREKYQLREVLMRRVS